MREHIDNARCWVEFDDEKKEFFGRDLTDHYNDPAFYNKTKRSYRKAKEALLKEFNQNTTMHNAMNILGANGIMCHSWCMVD
jgi:hypothetical protein